LNLPAGRRRDRPRERSPRGVAAVPQDIFFQPPSEAKPRRFGAPVSRRVRNLCLAAAVPIAVVIVAFSLFPTTDEPAAIREPKPPRAASEPVPEADIPHDSDLRSYSVSATEVAGLSLDSRPGSRLDLWVAWEPPITKEPRVQRLVEGVVLEKIVPPTVPEAPPTAVLLIAPRFVDEIIYGDIWGRLSVVTIPT
jgi:hypothetical protein